MNKLVAHTAFRRLLPGRHGLDIVAWVRFTILMGKSPKADEIAAKALAMGAKGFETGFIPESPDILWASKLLDNGKEQVIDFTAPTSPGDYPYVCSFPGHHVIMRGMMKVR